VVEILKDDLFMPFRYLTCAAKELDICDNYFLPDVLMV
jgi:hypothetical protein